MNYYNNQFFRNEYVNLFGGGIEKKWNTLKHNGLLFPDEYIQKFIPIIVNDKKIILNKEAEEYAFIYTKYLDSEYIKNKNFNKNFWNDWKVLLNNDLIKNLESCNFSLIKNDIIKKKEKDKLDKKNNIDNEKISLYKYATVDGVVVKVSNFKIEPPGIFIGRGNHPKLGMIKKRIYPEDITINIGKNELVPSLPHGHHWKNIIYDNTIEWIASWKDLISGKTKYVWLADKSKNDIKKYDIARKLGKKIHKIRKQIHIDVKNDKDIKIKQLATCIYLIDLLALRIGNEKKEDEADTVGVSSLRVEHIKLLENNIIRLKFLSKDSIEYNNEIKIDHYVWNNLDEFIKDKNKDDNIFEYVSTAEINEYLKSLMNNLTAKVFRTYNASHLF